MITLPPVHLELAINVSYVVPNPLVVTGVAAASDAAGFELLVNNQPVVGHSIANTFAYIPLNIPLKKGDVLSCDVGSADVFLSA